MKSTKNILKNKPKKKALTSSKAPHTKVAKPGKLAALDKKAPLQKPIRLPRLTAARS